MKDQIGKEPTTLFQERVPFEKRKSESLRIRTKYPDRVPVIVQKAKHSSLGYIDKSKYLVPQDLFASQFISIVRKRMKLKPENAVFLFIENTLLESNLLMSQVYSKHKDEDGFLYIYYMEEQTYG